MTSQPLQVEGWQVVLVTTTDGSGTDSVVYWAFVCMCVCVCLHDSVLECRTVSDVKVRQIPPKPLKDTARRMRGDNTVGTREEQHGWVSNWVSVAVFGKQRLCFKYFKHNCDFQVLQLNGVKLKSTNFPQFSKDEILQQLNVLLFVFICALSRMVIISFTWSCTLHLVRWSDSMTHFATNLYL